MPLDLARVQALCFDIDGTLADTDDVLAQRVAAVLALVPLVSGRRAESLARQVVMGAETPINAAYGLLDRFGLDATLRDARARFAALRARRRDAAHTRNPEAADEVPHAMMTGVQEMLKKLSGRYPMSTISTGGQDRIEAFLAHYDVLDCFRAVVTSETTARMKPYPDPLFHAARAMGVAPEACLMIGDTTVDIRTGVSAGAQTVGVLCGFGTARELVRAGAGLVLPTTSDVLAVLLPEEDALKGSAAPNPPGEPTPEIPALEPPRS